MSTWLRSFPVRAAAALLCVTCAIALARTDLPLQRLISADAAVIEEVQLLLPNEDGRALSLPVYWRSAEKEAQTRRFRIELPQTAMSSAELHLYVPYFEQRLRIVVGSTILYDSDDIRFWSGPVGYQSALVPIPAIAARTDGLELLVDTGIVPRGTLSSVYAGPRTAFLANYRLRGFLEERIKPMLYGAQLLLAIISLGIFWIRPSDRVFGWLGAALILTSVVGNGVLMSYIPSLESILREVYFLAPIVGMALLGFTVSLAGRKMPRFAFFLFPFLTFVSIALALLPEISVVDAVLLISIPGLLIAICWSFFVLVFSYGKRADTVVVLFLIGQIIIIYGVSHDLFVRLGQVEDGLLIARISNALVMAGMAAFLIGRQTEIANSLDAAASNLRARLSEREEELRSIHLQQQENDRQRTISAERQRITSDLHDGVAGHLATIVALSETDETAVAEIGQSAKNALVDLRLVLDALSLPEGSIGFALGSFRERCLLPLERLGIEIEWSINGLPEQMDISRETILNILRILQEAVNNAVRHGRPKTLHVNIDGQGGETLRFTVENTGGIPFAPNDIQSGLGLESMRRRAQAIGGNVTIEPTTSGARVTLSV